MRWDERLAPANQPTPVPQKMQKDIQFPEKNDKDRNSIGLTH